jgi:hypothetical protein
VRARTLTLRSVALLAAGSAAIHQLRYAIGYGPGADHQLAIHGHGYLALALPLVVAAAVLALAMVLARLARGGSTAQRQASSLPALWLGAVVALTVIYGLQESIEGAGAIAGGGWIGLALAIPAGLLVALAIKGASAAGEGIRTRGPALGFKTFIESASAAPRLIGAGRVAASGPGARAPPLASVV